MAFISMGANFDNQTGTFEFSKNRGFFMGAILSIELLYVNMIKEQSGGNNE
jgi:hypothetical protein